jgi:hypothetical protein
MTNATVYVKEINGATGAKTYTTVSSTVTSWMGCSDAYNSSPSTKIPIPSSGYSYSYWKSYYAEIFANPSSNTIDNLCFYMTTNADWVAGGKVGTAGGLKAGSGSGGTYGYAISGYEQATGTNNADSRWNGTEFVTGHTLVTTAVNYPTSATQFDAGAYASTGSSRYFCTQLKVDTNATLGTIGVATLHIQYDES